MLFSHTKNWKTDIFVLINFMCQLDWIMMCSGIWLNTVLFKSYFNKGTFKKTKFHFSPANINKNLFHTSPVMDI